MSSFNFCDKNVCDAYDFLSQEVEQIKKKKWKKKILVYSPKTIINFKKIIKWMNEIKPKEELRMETFSEEENKIQILMKNISLI